MIIGLSGYPNSGKSTIQTYVADTFGFETATFAKNLKDIAQQCLLLTEYQVYDQVGKEEEFAFSIGTGNIYDLIKWINKTHVIPNGAINKITRLLSNLQYARNFKTTTPRNILRILGTEVCRECISDTYHIDAARHTIQSFNNTIFDDARFPNEFAMCDYTILVKRAGTEYTELHASDKLLQEDEYDFVIEAESGDIASLHKQANVIMTDVLNKANVILLDTIRNGDI